MPNPSTPEVKVERYDTDMDGDMFSSEDGNFVYYSDHAAAIATLQAQLDASNARLLRGDVTIERLAEEGDRVLEVARLNRSTFTCTCAPEIGRIRAELMKKYGPEPVEPINDAGISPQLGLGE